MLLVLVLRVLVLTAGVLRVGVGRKLVLGALRVGVRETDRVGVRERKLEEDRGALRVGAR